MFLTVIAILVINVSERYVACLVIHFDSFWQR